MRPRLTSQTGFLPFALDDAFPVDFATPPTVAPRATLADLGGAELPDWAPARMPGAERNTQPMPAHSALITHRQGLPPWPALQPLILSAEQRAQAYCALTQCPLVGEPPLVAQPVVCIVDGVVFLFEWAELKRWLNSPCYRPSGDAARFINPYTRKPELWSSLRRVEPERPYRMPSVSIELI